MNECCELANISCQNCKKEITAQINWDKLTIIGVREYETNNIKLTI